MNLLDSLLDAIVRLEGDALVMHVGEKPYVVTTSAPLNAQRGSLSWGQVELSSRVLTTDAVLGMLVQILPLDQRQALEEYGAIEHEIPAPEGSKEHFTVIAARGGDDVWLEVRRRPKEEPQVAAPAAIEVQQPTVQLVTPAAGESPAVAAPESTAATVPAPTPPSAPPASEEIVGAAAPQPVVSPESRKPIAEEPRDIALEIIEEEEAVQDDEEVFEISLDAVSEPAEQESVPPVEVVHEISQSALTDEDVDALVASMTPPTDASMSAPPLKEYVPERVEIAAAEARRSAVESPEPVVAEPPQPIVEEQVAEKSQAEAVAAERPAFGPAIEVPFAEAEREPTSIAPASAEVVSDDQLETVTVAPVVPAVAAEEPKLVAPPAAPVPPEAVPAVAEAAAALEAFADVAAHPAAALDDAVPAHAPHIPDAAAAASDRSPEAMEVIAEAAAEVPQVAATEELEDETPAAVEAPAEVKPAVAPGTIEVAANITSEIVDEQLVDAPAVAEAITVPAVMAVEAVPEIDQVVAEPPPVIQPPPTSETISRHAPAAQERAEPVSVPSPGAPAVLETVSQVMPDRAVASTHQDAAPFGPAPRVEVPSPVARRQVEQPAAAPSSTGPVEELRPALVVPISRSPIRPEPPAQTPAAALAPVEHMLRIAAARGASTVYIVAHSKPMIRVDGEISALENEPTFTTADVDRLVMDIAPVRGRDVHGGPGEWMTDVPEVGRVRCVTFREHRGQGVIFRMIPPRAISADQLGLAAEVQALCAQPDGLVLVTGARASGKSTLLSAFVDLINRTRSDHVITVESQINFVHESRKSFVSQREVRGDADAAAAAVRSAFREDPDVLVIEDLRTAEIVSVAIEAAESGRLVLGSLSAPNTIAAIERLVELYSPERRAQVQTALAGALRGVVAQVLLRKIKGGRVAAREVLLNTPAVASLILEGRTFQLPVALDAGRRHGMVPMTDSLAALVHDGTVHVAEAYRKALDREALLAVLKRDGVDTSFAERLA